MREDGLESEEKMQIFYHSVEPDWVESTYRSIPHTLHPHGTLSISWRKAWLQSTNGFHLEMWISYGTPLIQSTYVSKLRVFRKWGIPMSQGQTYLESPTSAQWLAHHRLLTSQRRFVRVMDSTRGACSPKWSIGSRILSQPLALIPSSSLPRQQAHTNLTKTPFSSRPMPTTKNRPPPHMLGGGTHSYI